MNMSPKALKTRVREQLDAQSAETGDASLLVNGGRWPADRVDGSAPVAFNRPGESLPVLEAFQKYLDRERAQARRRLVGLTAFFAILLIALVGGAVVAALVFLSPWRKDMDEMQGRLSDLQVLATGMKGENVAAVSGVREETERLRATLEEESAHVAELRTEAADRSSKHQSDMRSIVGLVKRLVETNRSLANRLSELQAAQSALPPIPAQENPMPSTSGTSLIEMPVRPRGSRAAVRWRVSIPANLTEDGVNAENAVLRQ